MSLKQLVLSAFLLSSSLTSSLSYADSIGWGNRPNPGAGSTRPNLPTVPNDPWANENSSSNSKTVEENIQKYFSGQSKLDLLADFYIRSQLQGVRIKDITIIASTEQGAGQASLLLNGQFLESSKLVARQMASYSFKVDPFANIVGQSLSSIELGMQGRFYVEKVIFNVFEASSSTSTGSGHSTEGTRAEVIRQQLNERIQEEGGLELFRIFNLGMEKRGQIIKRVSVIARSDRGFAQASLLVNNQQISTAQTVFMGSNRLTFELGQSMSIGREIQSLRLYFRGNLTVEEVSIEIESREGSRNPLPPSIEQRFEQILNQRLYDTSGVDLRSLIQIPSRFDDRVINSVDLILRNSDMGVRLKLCQVIQDRFQTANCSVPVITSSGAQVVRLLGVNLAKLRETTLSSRMGMIDIDRIVINFR